ncbi:MAG: hypothetical protein FWD61_09405 [Phycisphaerales bacterium]|nr:hypothetical protein [Phycisphaerales bacterium]
MIATAHKSKGRKKQKRVLFAQLDERSCQMLDRLLESRGTSKNVVRLALEKLYAEEFGVLPATSALATGTGAEVK